MPQFQKMSVLVKSQRDRTLNIYKTKYLDLRAPPLIQLKKNSRHLEVILNTDQNVQQEKKTNET